MADVLMGTLIILGFYVSMLSYWLIAYALAPKLVSGSRTSFENTPWKNILVGLLVGTPIAIAGFLLFAIPNPAFKILGFAVILLPLLMGLFGSAGLCEKIGQGLSMSHDEGQDWLRVRRGGIVLGLTFIFPLLGWFLVMPVVLISGIGALFLSWRAGRREVVAPPPIQA
ncbi:MAG: hypothetical protein ACON5H_05475 [Akkermansiaceae bacterium]